MLHKLFHFQLMNLRAVLGSIFQWTQLKQQSLYVAATQLHLIQGINTGGEIYTFHYVKSLAPNNNNYRKGK
ncbi:hypothetical protein PSEUDO8O_150096 [Pseudomonas sp. 8O]|nr:hypothetical protein PSEUDO8O_150096 [Pseudomonas sp. 8O]